MSGYSSNTSATSTSYSPNQAPTSSPLSSFPILTPSAFSTRSPSQERSNGDSIACELTRPSESDYLAFECDLLDPNKAKIAVTAMHEFLTAMEKATAPPASRQYNSRENLQAYLIQQQLVAGIPVDQIKPMPEFASKPDNEGVVRRVGLPAYITITSEGSFVPDIPPAEFNGTLEPLPLDAGFPNPDWVNRAVQNFRNQMDNNATNSTNTVNTTGQQPAQSMVDQNSAGSKPARNGVDLSTYFASDKEQKLISQFFAEHFSTGSGILNPESIMAIELADDGTDSDYGTDYWSDTNDA